MYRTVRAGPGSRRQRAGGTARARKRVEGGRLSSGRGAGGYRPGYTACRIGATFIDCSRELAQKPSRCLSCALGAVRVRVYGCSDRSLNRTVPYRHDRGAAGGRGVPCSRPRRLPRPRRAVMVDMSCLERPRKGGRLRVCGTLTAVLNRDLELRRQRDTPHPYLSRYRGTHLLSSAPSACL